MSKKDNVIWTVEGTVKDHDKMMEMMQEIVAAVEKEPFTLNYEWTLNGDTLHVYERYADCEGAKKHLVTWGKFAPRFAQYADMTKLVVFSELDDELKEAMSGMNPIYMKPIGGFAK